MPSPDHSVIARILSLESAGFGPDPYRMRLRLPAETTILVLPLDTLELPDGPITVGEAVILDGPRGSCNSATIRGVLVSKRDYRTHRAWKGVAVKGSVKPAGTRPVAMSPSPAVRPAVICHRRRHATDCPVCLGQEVEVPGGNEHCDICHRVVEPGLTRRVSDPAVHDGDLVAVCYTCDERV
jgi:hypothetical protein